jgi:hypothetical protein
MSRYIKKFTKIGSAGPTEERGFAIWVGYELAGVDGDLTAHGLVNVDDWSDDELATRGVTTFIRVEPEDDRMYAKLGIPR